MQLDGVLRKVLKQVQLEVYEEFGVKLDFDTVKECVIAQREAIRYGMMNRINIILPYLGRFNRYNEKNKLVKKVNAGHVRKVNPNKGKGRKKKAKIFRFKKE